MVVSSACMKNATATSQGKNRFTASNEMADGTGTVTGVADALPTASECFSIRRN
jgi:hypothetical protein